MFILGEIIGWEFLLVLALIALLFGSSKLPKLARSMGQAKSELEKGMREGADKKDDPAES
jgi:sec-independent protein translocase protein TatA